MRFVRLGPLMVITMVTVVCAPAEQSPVCRITEDSIFADCAISAQIRPGTMRTEDLTVEGLSIGRANLETVEGRFPGTRRFRLTKEEESPVGICVANRLGYAVVFASGYAGGWKILDSIYIAPAKSLERQGAKCMVAPSLSADLSTRSGIGPGVGRDRLRTLLPGVAIEGSFFEIDYSTSPDKAPWVSGQITPARSEGWTAMSGATGGFRAGKLRWLVLYGAVSN